MSALDTSDIKIRRYALRAVDYKNSIQKAQ